MRQSNRMILLILATILLISGLVTANVFLVAVVKVHARSGTDLTDYVSASNVHRTVQQARRGYILDRNGTIIAQDNVTQRKAYDIEAFTLPRHCSFIASTNNRQCLQDIGGNRRFLPITITGIDYHTPVNHPGIYAQALALLKGGFRYWYEGEEIEQLNKHNERHRMKDPVEENLFVFFRKPLPEDLQVKWLPASVILTKLSIFGKVQVNPHTQLVLVQALEKYGFGTRTNEQETTEYEVVDIQLYQ